MHARRLFSWSVFLLMLSVAQGRLVAQANPAQGTGTVPGNGLPALKTAMDREKVDPEDRIQLWVSITNTTGADMHGLKFLSISHPELKPVGPCWRDGRPACAYQKDSGTPALRPLLNLKAGETATFTAKLLATGEAAEVSVSGLLGWHDAAGEERSSVLVPIGKIQIAPRWSAWQWSFGLAKDLALPIVLIFLGWRFRVLEQRRTQIQQTWSQMLQKSHENAERYYMPLSSAIFNLRLLEENKGSEPQAAASTLTDRRLCDLLVIQRRYRELIRKIGGWYFKTREGENTAGEIWDLFRLRTEHWLTETCLNHALELLEPEDNRTQVQRRIQREPILTEALHGGLQRWIDDGEYELILRLLHMVEIVLDFEMNHPYEFWYGRREPFPTARFNEALQALERQTVEDEKVARTLADLLILLRGYQRHYQGRLARIGAKIARPRGGSEKRHQPEPPRDDPANASRQNPS